MHRTIRLSLLAAVAVSFAATVQAGEKKAERFFEMRTYTTAEGKLDDLHARFRDHTNRLFEKHGMELVGYWVPTDEALSQNTLVYVLAYKSKEARDKCWDDFRNDPEWKKVREESQADGPIVVKVVSQFLTPTDYSPIK